MLYIKVINDIVEVVYKVKAPSLNFRHLCSPFFLHTMNPPSPDKLRRNFVMIASQAKRLKLCYALVGLEVSEWNDLDSLAGHAMTLRRKNLPVDASLFLDCYKSTLSKIAQNYTNKYDALRSFARKLNAYLKNAAVATAYSQKFNALKLQDEGKKAKTQMMAIAQVNATKVASVAGLELKRNFDAITESEANIEAANIDTANIDEALIDEALIDEALSNDAGVAGAAGVDAGIAGNSAITDQPRTKAISCSTIKHTIFKKAEQLQEMYAQGAKITPDERKLLSCGSSLILNLVDQSEGSCVRLIFNEGEWRAIKEHFESKHKLPEVVIQKAPKGSSRQMVLCCWYLNALQFL
ncbi:hypothetical protein MBANPS3_011892 [Mucor bainieri]